MLVNARHWGLVTGGIALGVAGVLGFAGSTASAEPVVPPAPAIVTQTVAVPVAAAAAPNQVGALPVAGTPQPAAVPVAQVPAIVPATSQTITDYFKEKNVAMEAQKLSNFDALNIVLPMPTGWTHVPDPNVPDAFAVLADRVGGDGLYTSNAAVVVYRLLGDFDPREAISHGFIDSQQLPAWRATGGSLAEFGGMPSSIIEGTYRQNNLTLNSSRRHVIAASGPFRYLVTMTVTTSAQVSVAAADATDAVVNGFKVISPDAAKPPVAAPAAATPAVASAVPS